MGADNRNDHAIGENLVRVSAMLLLSDLATELDRRCEDLIMVGIEC